MAIGSQRLAQRVGALITIAAFAACAGANRAPISGNLLPAASTLHAAPARVETFVLSLSAPPTIGTPAKLTLSCVAYDGNGNIIKGPYSPEITVVDRDRSGQTSLSGKFIKSSSQTLTLTYRGKGDSFSIVGTVGQTSHTYRFVTTLPAEIPLATPAPGNLTVPTQLRFGADGNLWSVVNGQNIPRNNITVARITPAGQVTLFSDPNGQHWFSDWTEESIAKGSDGAMWFPYGSGGGEDGFDRVDSSGNFTSFSLPNTVGDAVTSLAAGPDAAIWFATTNSSGPKEDVALMKADGSVTVMAGSLPATPYNLVFGPDGNMWFTMGAQVAKITPSGVLTTYDMPVVAHGNAPMYFAVGPDGNFWSPYPDGDNELLKFNTSGQVVSVKKYTALPVPQVTDVAGDASGIWVSDWNYGVVRIGPNGTANEFPTYAPNSLPESIATGNGTIYFADTLSEGSGSTVGGLGSVLESNW